MFERLVGVSRNYGGIVKQVQQLSGLFGQQDLLLGALDDGSGLEVVGFLQLLAGDVGQLSLGDKRLCFSTDELLLKGHNLGRGGFLVLQLLDLILDLWVELALSPRDQTGRTNL